MNREMQSKLVAILRDAMNAQGISQSDLARHVGTSSGMISQAFSCKGQMRDERWRMCCELCGVDFDRFMGETPAPSNEGALPKGEPTGIRRGGNLPPVPQSRAEQSRAEQTEPVNPSVGASAASSPTKGSLEKEAPPMSSNPKAVAELNRAECDMLAEFIELSLPIAATHLITTVTYDWLDSMIKMHDYLKDSADIVD